MKPSTKISSIALRFVAMLSLVFMTTLTWAQDQGIDVDVNLDKGGDAWYANPIVWIIGVAVFILLLVALMRSGSKDA